MADPSSRRRLLVLAVALAAAAGLFAAQQARQGEGFAALPLHDFVEYWAAGRLLARGEDPYDIDRLRELEREVGRDDDPLLMWNPPWALPLVILPGLLPVRTAHLLWLLFHLGVLFFCADRLWHLYEGREQRRVPALLVAATFVPCAMALIAGQITPLVLLGAVGFLLFVSQEKDFLAGMAAALLGVKPHLVWMFWIALAAWSWRTRRPGVIAGGVAAGLALSAVALACRPDVFALYWRTLSE